MRMGFFVMASSYKCCVGGCNSTSNTKRLFCMPANDHLRSLWMSFLVPTSPSLLGLTKNQLMTKRVCERHFDQSQFDQAGVRIRYSYPCLLTEKEIAHGVPLAKGYHILDDHTYCECQENDDNLTQEINIIKGDISQEHQYSLPSTSYSSTTLHLQNTDGESAAMITEVTEQEKLKDIRLYSEMQHISDTDKINKCMQKTTSSKRRVQLSSKTRRYIRQCTKLASEPEPDIAQKHEENLSLMANFKNLNKKAKAFLFMQLKLARKNKMARRFSLEDKLFGLALMKQSPKGYKLLEKMFALPNKRTLARLSSKIEFECGINKNIFDYIKIIAQDWDSKKKLCSLIFDEVALTPHLTYAESKDNIIGFVEIAGERRPKLADHALVFMIRGICSPWRQCIAYYFCEGTVSSILMFFNA